MIGPRRALGPLKWLRMRTRPMAVLCQQVRHLSHNEEDLGEYCDITDNGEESTVAMDDWVRHQKLLALADIGATCVCTR